jgi:hypothetical protein
MVKALGIALGLALLIATPALAQSEPLPTDYPFLVYIQAPDGSMTNLTCSQLVTTDPAVWDAVMQAGGNYYMGLDVGAHQPAVKLVCSEGWG